jgi:hypothetical protein
MWQEPPSPSRLSSTARPRSGSRIIIGPDLNAGRDTRHAWKLYIKQLHALARLIIDSHAAARTSLIFLICFYKINNNITNIFIKSNKLNGFDLSSFVFNLLCLDARTGSAGRVAFGLHMSGTEAPAGTSTQSALGHKPCSTLRPEFNRICHPCPRSGSCGDLRGPKLHEENDLGPCLGPLTMFDSAACIQSYLSPLPSAIWQLR